MDTFPHDETPEHSARRAQVIAHLDGALQARMLDAMAGVWATLEQASTDRASHARAVRSRLFWETLAPGTADGHGTYVDAAAA